MSSWDDVYERACVAMQAAGRDTLFYRGQADANWRLLPGIARVKRKRLVDLEQAMAFDFVNRGGHLLQEDEITWRNVFAMQHHGLPTRLLDWSETFAIALYFALREGAGDAAVWILDPYELNRTTCNRPSILDAYDLKLRYSDLLDGKRDPTEGEVLALSPPARHPRVFNQRGGFTLHIDYSRALEDIAPKTLTKLVIPANARDDARAYLKSAGISEFSLFPDLDGLARELRDRYL